MKKRENLVCYCFVFFESAVKYEEFLFLFSFWCSTASYRNLVSLITSELAFHRFTFAFWQLKMNYQSSQCKETFCTPKKGRHLTVTQEITGNTGFYLNCSGVRHFYSVHMVSIRCVCVCV